MQDSVCCCAIGLGQVGSLDFQGADEVIGGVFWPFHQVEVVLDVGSISVLEALCEVDVQVTGWSRGFDHKAFFGLEQLFAIVVLWSEGAVNGQAGGAYIVLVCRHSG